MRTLIRAYDIGALICFSAMMGCVLLEVVARNIVHFPKAFALKFSISHSKHLVHDENLGF